MMQNTKNKKSDLDIAIAQLYQRADSINRLVIVEGPTDQSFIRNFLNEGVKSKPIKQVLRQEELKNNKDAIVKVCYALYDSETFQNLSDEQKEKITALLKKCDVYGMIDKDFDDIENYSKLLQLFITDTHDLETLLLSTDENLLQRLSIKKEELKISLFIAYQFGLLKIAIYNFNKSWRSDKLKLSFEKDYAEYVLSEALSQFLNDFRFDFNKLLDDAFNPKLYQHEKKAIFSDSSISNYITNFGQWCLPYDKFITDNVPKIWDIVNGHDILCCLRYVNKNAGNKYRSSSNCKSKFEQDIIKMYKKENFMKTKISKRMSEQHLLL